VAAMLLFSGNANIPLAKNIASILSTTLGLATISQYPDGESKIEIHHDVRDQDVFIIQSTSFPANSHILELCLLANALRSKQPRSITTVVPYFGYGRHDGDLHNGHSSAKLIMDLLLTAGINNLLTLDLHSDHLANVSDIALKNISAIPLFANISPIQNLQKPVIVAPDMGAVRRAKKFSIMLSNAPVAILDKLRNKNNTTTAVSIIGNVTGRNCIIVDDILDTGNTIYTAAVALKAQGATQIYACCTHAVFSHDAISLLNQSPCDKIFVTDSILPSCISHPNSKIHVIAAASLLATTILTSSQLSGN
jgi:ribose-phosphate pyrophosphokinase